MMVNNNSAVHFYGRRPHLAGHLPSHYAGIAPLPYGPSHSHAHDLAAAGKAAGQIFMPGSQGSKAIGTLIDKYIGLTMSIIKQAYPALGEALSFVGDIVDFILEPVGNLIESMAFGAATYLEAPQADAVLKDMDANWSSYAKDAFLDCLYAFYRRVGSSGSKAADIKEGRDPIIQSAMGGALDLLGVGRNANRVAYRVYTKAMAAGAKDWQAAAACCFGVLKGLQIKGFPSGFKINIKGADVATVTGVDSGKAIFPLGNEFDSVYFAKLGTPVVHTLAWVEQQYKIKSGGVVGDAAKSAPRTPSNGGGSLFPLLAIAGAAFLATRGK